MSQPLMPHATASWLVDNTALSFDQIAEFCGLHILEVQAIADDTASIKYTGRDPVRAHEITMDEIHKGEANPDYKLKMLKGPEPVRPEDLDDHEHEGLVSLRRGHAHLDHLLIGDDGGHSLI